MITVALDAMGGDHAPRAETEGAVLAVRELGVRVQLVGIESVLRQELDRHRHTNLPIEIVNADEIITMTDSPSHAFRRKKGSSMHVAAHLVREGGADAFVTAGEHRCGHDGGAVCDWNAALRSTVRRWRRAAFSQHERQGFDRAGCRRECGLQARSNFEQFAVMGEIYYRAIWGSRRPRVALLSIGEEETKGNELTREAANRLKLTSLNFVGNVEGRDVFRGACIAIVCDEVWASAISLLKLS